MAIAVAMTAVVVASDDESAPLVERPDRPVTVCNGRVALCARPLNEVVFPGTHNSMAAADERGWFFAAHRGGLAKQLEFGVRALLIDTHYGVRDKEGNVRTDLEREGTNRQKIVDAIGEEALAAAERLVGRIGFGELEGDTDIYMCHTLCELGATPLVDGLRDIREFLDKNPDEFVILFVQDETVPKDTAAVFDRAGLTRYAHVHERDEPWPDMRELIASDERLLVLAESDARGTPPWYHDGFELTQETPYTFHSLEELEPPRSCRAEPRLAEQPAVPAEPLDRAREPLAGARVARQSARSTRPPRQALRREARAPAEHRRRRLLRRGRPSRRRRHPERPPAALTSRASGRPARRGRSRTRS